MTSLLHFELLFAFDNSMSHHKRAPDALVVTDLTIKDNPAAVKTVMRDGWYLRERMERRLFKA